MIKVGDKVRFLNSVGGGKVTGFENPKVALVEDDEGFEVPCLVSELVLIEPVSQPAAAAAGARPAPVVQETKKPAKEVQPLFASSAGKPASVNPAWFLAFVPEVPTSPLSGEIKTWLVNDSRQTLLFHFSLLENNGYRSVKSGRLAPYARIPLHGFGHADLSTLPDFAIQLLPYESNSPALHPALSKTIRINPVKFYKENSYVPNAYFEKRALLIEIKEKELTPELEKLQQHDFHAPSVEASKEAKPTAKPRRSETTELKEVDLHIHELVEISEGLSNKEILDLQMERFRFEMETAIHNGTRRVVFIHGVGQGTLKNELRRELSSRYKKYDFQDASFKEYGYGATMVILRR